MGSADEFFDFEIDVQGAWVVAKTVPLTHKFAGDVEIDANIQRMKDNLDAVARAMKQAVRAQKRVSPFGR